ncbi:SF1B family DNA helicase RecD2 [Acholeplasma hippikon]|uniref:ATP-dependent RecD2 DNA helicase n=1 Tax=Acholeplasma hippikon TaxID=264636 RepID=A0A449BIK8_9MOLU|nr:ATP-dependent RecD-like DNA helicase [Acholeplasma hippikon]VEU82301.1 exodeoxyribonuclease V subunit alpha [Acholeplasma hippikon]
MNDTLRGYVKSYKYKNEENGYTIAKMETDSGEIITIVGYFPILNEEVLYEFTGEFTYHPKYGKQLKVLTYKRIEDHTENGLIRYLSSEDFTGIGPVTAKKIVDLLGLDAIDKIIEDESVLSPLLNPMKRVRLKNELIQHKATNDVFIKLLDFGLSNKVAAKLFKTYGAYTLDKLNEDPFRLMYEIDGFGFVKSQDIANKLGIEKEDIRTLKAASIYVLETAAYGEGNLYLEKEELVEKVQRLLYVDVSIDEALMMLEKEAKIKSEDNLYFLNSIYYAEYHIAQSIKSIINQDKKAIDRNLLELYLSQIAIQKGIEYTEKQNDAIISAMLNPMTIITGGPGTGKTTLIDGLLTLYATYYKINLKEVEAKLKIALMAPTGRASKRMRELLHFEAKTIHSHLGYDFDQTYKYYKDEPLPQNLIIVDEASMVDIFLAKRLFDAIKVGAQVIIVGDEDQLPSVGPGYVLGDMIASKLIPVVRLTEIHRQAKDSNIVRLAQSVNKQVLADEDLISHKDVIFYNGNIDNVKSVILNQIAGAIKKGYDLINDIQVLIPLYKGDLGIDIMNQEIQKRFNPYYEKSLSMKIGEKTYYRNDKVIQLVNDKERKVMNGDIGVIDDIILGEKNTLLMKVVFDSTIVYYEQADLENINLAYVVSIHKSQGSEYKIVFLPIIKSYLHMLKKELIYTAITRAKEYLLILGDMKLLRYASNQLAEKRHTKLKERLIENEVVVEDNFDEDLEDPTIHLSPYDFM